MSTDSHTHQRTDYLSMTSADPLVRNTGHCDGQLDGQASPQQSVNQPRVAATRWSQTDRRTVLSRVRGADDRVMT